MENFLEKIKESMKTKIKDITEWQKREAYYIAADNYKHKDNWQDFKLGQNWSEEEDITTFFKTKVKLPNEIKEEEKFVMHIETGGEAALYINDELIQGLDRNHAYVTINNKEYLGKEVELFIEAALDRINKIYVPDPNYEHKLSTAELILINKQAEDFYYNIISLIELINTLKKRNEDAKAREMKNIFEQIKNQYYIQAGTQIDYEYLNKKFESLIEEVDFDTSYKIACFGHAHIDVAWLWQFKETIRKSARSFSTAVNLMDEYPAFKFIQSQPQLYWYIKEYYPELYEKMKKKIEINNWQPEGGMWVEADTNLLSGESLVRQFLYGKKFLKEEFDYDSKVCWLPDVFGYTASLPQIMKKSEVDYFMTSKISWNDTNEFPYSIFHWEGLDGTDVLTHVPRVILPQTYNGEVEADKILDVRDNYEEQKEDYEFEFKYGDSSNYFKKDRVVPDDQLIYIYGYGDGGGGVTAGFINKIKKFNKLPYMPRLEFAQPKEYFDNLKKDMVKNKREYPTWRGELYLEYHRGTYTSQSEIKLQNRRLEDKIREAEILNTITDLYPQSDIEKNWKKINLNQFHDIIPGSSIKEVYKDVNEIYDNVDQNLDKIIANTLDQLINDIGLNKNSNSKYYLIWNGLDYKRSTYIQFNKKELNFSENNISFYDPVKKEEIEFTKRKNLNDEIIYEIYLEDIPSFGYKVIEIKENENDIKTVNQEITDNKTVENAYYKLKFEKGKITSLYDKRREVELIEEGKAGNELQFFVDKPDRFEAWEQDADFEEHRIEDELELQEFKINEYKTEKVVTLKWKFRKSTFKQNIILYNNLDRIDFKNKVVWKDREILVKTAWPVNIVSDQARYEIAYGNITRPTTNNTSFEKAQFEVPGHRWADLSEPGLGFSILNDCKYGYDIKDNLVRLTLLKSPNYPDETADYGIHEFTYSIYTHNGIYYNSNLLDHANDLNRKVLKKEIKDVNNKDKETKQLVHSYLEKIKGNSKIEVIKKPEYQKSGYVLRLYEPYGGKDQVQIEFNKNIKEAKLVNLIENEKDQNINYNENILKLDMDPFEIKTVLIIF